MAQLKRGGLTGFNTGSESRPLKHNGVIVSTSPGLNFREGPGIGISTSDDGRLAHADVELRTSFKEDATFPTHPRHGDAHIIAGPVDGLSWMFVYNGNTSDTMKWEFVGGAPAHSRVVADFSIILSSQGANYLPSDCTVTMPAGITWDVHCIFGCRSWVVGGTGGSQAYFTLSHDGAVATDSSNAVGDAYAAQSQQTNTTYGDPLMTCTSSVEFTDVAASDAIVFEGRCVGAGTSVAHFTRRYLTVWPIRAKNA